MNSCDVCQPSRAFHLQTEAILLAQTGRAVRRPAQSDAEPSRKPADAADGRFQPTLRAGRISAITGGRRLDRSLGYALRHLPWFWPKFLPAEWFRLKMKRSSLSSGEGKSFALKE
ncbi:hypothetical protein OE766_12545 [Pararhizobium sp. YC-54]|uniref:hypothetical protein n=1 Tax=Pararhizobium sp. YC-54 TaxID=2986920 RepID=UPI0021F767B7|nr:hypothetical protein [Pararhizobium sp. YC-54]MCV9999080.1 hypothetical protein [Pararhizobium sp. YC-54]